MLSRESDFTVVNTPLPHWANFRLGDPGWLYILKNGDLLKVGKTKDPKRRLYREARTWLPNAELVGVKPFWNIHDLERILHCGLANAWYSGEWHRFSDDSYSHFLTDGFCRFDDHDRNRNNVEFGYWINSSGMVELIAERRRRRLSLRKWQREA
jgi:hypothetical protein